MIRILIADDHTLFRQGLSRLLTELDFEIVGEAGDGAEAQRLALEVRPDIVLMDLHMPVMGGVEATRRLSEKFPILILTVSENDEDLRAAIDAGARGYLLKNEDPAALKYAIENVARGGSVLSAIIADALLDRARRSDQSDLELLSPREQEVLTLLSRGLSNREIADTLGISSHTVKTHLERTYEKLGVSSRSEAAAIAGAQGLR